MTLVIDASVALKWFLTDEPGGDRALAVLRSGTVLMAPDIIIGEVCNAAWKSARLGRITRTQLHALANVLPRFFDTLATSVQLIARAVEIADRLDHPVCDCLYLSLAEAGQANFVTADDRLLGKVRGTQWTSTAIPLASFSAESGSNG